jgi:hypothetical protein
MITKRKVRIISVFAEDGEEAVSGDENYRPFSNTGCLRRSDVSDERKTDAGPSTALRSAQDDNKKLALFAQDDNKKFALSAQGDKQKTLHFAQDDNCCSLSKAHTSL